MKDHMHKLFKVILYFFTPEDSATPIRNGAISFNIEYDMVGIGSAKAVFWLLNTILLMVFVSLL